MPKNDQVAIVCCSNGLERSQETRLAQLDTYLHEIGLIPVWSQYIYESEHGINADPGAKAEELMEFFQAEEIQAIFDISGGDLANTLLPYLDFELIGQSQAVYYGYSDLTTLINAIYAKTGKSSVLYQVRNLIRSDSQTQRQNFAQTILEGQSDLYDFDYRFVQGSEIKGILVGGNIRCLLKLAGTDYWPSMQDKILLLESYSGDLPQMYTYLAQLQQLGVFDQLAGILLGTFSQMDKEDRRPTMADLVRDYVGDRLPIASTREIGHGPDSKAAVIGRDYHFG